MNISLPVLYLFQLQMIVLFKGKLNMHVIGTILIKKIINHLLFKVLFINIKKIKVICLFFIEIHMK